MKTHGQVAFEAYNAARGGVTHDGKPTPPWEDLGDGVRSGWEAAARELQAVLAPKDVWAIYQSVVAAREGIAWIVDDGLPARELALTRTKLEEAESWLERAMLRSEREGHRESVRAMLAREPKT